MSTTGRKRLSAAERRASVVMAGCRVFAQNGFRGTTTAELARAAEITEPILYRHFDSKLDLYLVCIETVWEEVRTAWESAFERYDRANWWAVMGRTFLDMAENQTALAGLWVQALTETTREPRIDEFLTAHMQQVHEYVTWVVRESQQAGGVAAERDPGAEAWIIISLGLLSTVGQRLGGVVKGDFPKVALAHQAWITGGTA